MLDLFRSPVGERVVQVAVTERSDGDVHPRRVDPHELRRRQLALTETRWAMAHQVHGIDVWHATGAVDPAPEGDVVVVDATGCGPDALAMWAADCATAILVTEHRLVGVHAGWRGLSAGVVDRAVDEARANATDVVAVVTGPMIGPCCYEFDADDLMVVAAGVGVEPDDIAGRTRTGELALDVDAALRAAMVRRGLRPTASASGCTGCAGRWFSHRARVDRERHALVGWWR